MGNVAESTVKDAADKSLDALEGKVLDGLDAARKVAESAVNNTAEVQKQAEATVKSVTDQVSVYVQEKPLQAAGIAFAAGVVATFLLSVDARQPARRARSSKIASRRCCARSRARQSRDAICTHRVSPTACRVSCEACKSAVSICRWHSLDCRSNQKRTQGYQSTAIPEHCEGGGRGVRTGCTPAKSRKPAKSKQAQHRIEQKNGNRLSCTM